MVINTYIKVNDTLYPAHVSGRMVDRDWDGRESKLITLTMTHDEAVNIFKNDTPWSIVEEITAEAFDQNGNSIGEETTQNEYDNSEYCVAGDITDHRDGTITAKMGKYTEIETILLAGL